MKRRLRRCEICDEPRVRDYHHIVPKCMGGGNEAWNRVNLCPNHHRLVHDGLIVIHGWDDLGYTCKLNYEWVDRALAKPLIPIEVRRGKRQRVDIS